MIEKGIDPSIDNQFLVYNLIQTNQFKGFIFLMNDERITPEIDMIHLIIEKSLFNFFAVFLKDFEWYKKFKLNIKV